MLAACAGADAAPPSPAPVTPTTSVTPAPNDDEFSTTASLPATTFADPNADADPDADPDADADPSGDLDADAAPDVAARDAGPDDAVEQDAPDDAAEQDDVDRSNGLDTPADSSPPDTATTTSTIADDPGADLAAAESEGDEPVFDLGPTVALDVDLARFPQDDAGQGGGDSGSTPGDPATPGDDESKRPAPAGWAGFDASLGAALLRPGNTSASVAVMIGGDLVHTAAFGVRDPARGDAATTTDRFRIASISKPITAIVALQLVEDGLIGLDDPIGALVGDHIGATRVSDGAGRLTLRQLLTHRSGFGKFRSQFFGGTAMDCADAARQGLARGVGGGGYVYSNMNYCLAGLVIEAVTGESLERATYRLLLTPLGISGMRLAPTIDPGPGEAQHRTTPGRNYMEVLGGAGAWIASPTDLVTVLDSLDHTTPGFKPLEPATVWQVLTPPGGRLGDRGYGLGVISYGEGRVGHTGTIEATHAMLLDRGDGVTWAVTVAGDWPAASERLEQVVDDAFVAGGFVAG